MNIINVNEKPYFELIEFLKKQFTSKNTFSDVFLFLLNCEIKQNSIKLFNTKAAKKYIAKIFFIKL